MRTKNTYNKYRETEGHEKLKTLLNTEFIRGHLVEHLWAAGQKVPSVDITPPHAVAPVYVYVAHTHVR